MSTRRRWLIVLAALPLCLAATVWAQESRPEGRETLTMGERFGEFRRTFMGDGGSSAGQSSESGSTSTSRRSSTSQGSSSQRASTSQRSASQARSRRAHSSSSQQAQSQQRRPARLTDAIFGGGTASSSGTSQRQTPQPAGRGHTTSPQTARRQRQPGSNGGQPTRSQQAEVAEPQPLQAEPQLAEANPSRSSRRTAQPGYAPSTGRSGPLPTLASPEPAEESPAPRVAARPQQGRTPTPAPRMARSTDASAREALREADETLSEIAEDEERGPATAGEPTPAPSGGSSSAAGGVRAELPRMTVDELDVPSVASSPDEFVVTRRSPELRLETSGPRRLLVGRPAKYRVAVFNAGEVPAGDVAVLVELPDFAEVVGTEATSGNAQPVTDGAAGAFRWTVPQLKARGKQELTLEIVARQDRPFELGVSWTSAPTEAVAKIEVRQAKLQLALSGPKEVSYGEKSIFKLTFSNPGTADAENVVVKLLPLDAESDQAETHTLGSLAAGASKEVELELVARQQGQLHVNIEATADGELKASVSEEVLVRRAGLQVAIEAPKFQYSGALAAYKVTVSNPGDEPAKNVRVTAKLPRGAAFVSASADGVHDEAEGQVAWTLSTMQPGQVETLQLRCNLEMSGPNLLAVEAAADGELTAAVEEATQVEATADLALEVRDPGGPMPVDEEVVYEVVVRNRGAKAATDIEVVGFFSNGIDPVKVEGSEYVIEDGKVLLTPIATLAAGDERVYKIRARAHFRGNHIFRAEVHCHSPESALAQEGTTRYYAADEDPHAAPVEGAAPQNEAADAADADDANTEGATTPNDSDASADSTETATEPMEATEEADAPVESAEESPAELAEVAPMEAASAAVDAEAPKPQRLGWRPRRQPTPAVDLAPAGDGAPQAE